MINYKSMFTAGRVALLILLFSMLTTDVSLAADVTPRENIKGQFSSERIKAAAAGGYEYDSRMVYDLCAPDQIVSSKGGRAEWGYYHQYQTHNGRLTGPGTFLAAPWNTCLANPDYTYLLWRGAGEATFWLRGADDGGKASNNPGTWGEWVRLSGEGKRLEIPGALDGKQFIQCRFELGEGVQLSQLEIHKKMTLPDHPRIYLTPQRVEQARKRIAADPEIKRLYKHYLNFMRKHSGSGDMRERNNAWVSGWWMTSVGVAWNLSQDPVLLEEARAQLASLETPWAKGLGHFEHPQLLGGAATLIDLVWNALSTEEQKHFGRLLLEFADKQQRAWRFSDVSNQIYVNSGKNVLAGLALAGAGIDQEKEAFYLRQAEDFMRLHLIPGSNFWASDDGGWIEGHGYCSFTMKDWALEAHAWASASGEDVFQKANFFCFLSQWRVYERRYDGSMAKFNDSGRGGMGVPCPAYIASRWGDRHAQKQAKAAIEQALARPDDYSNTHLWQEVLWYDPKLPAAEDYTYPETMPLGRHFAGIGHVVAKSGWKPNDLWAIFNSGTAFTPGTHYHADENSFIIDRGGSMAIDSGSDDRSCPHYPGYFQRSVAHNTITVKKPGEKFRGPGNDGGQIGGSWLERYGGRFDSAQYGLHLPPQKLALRGIVAFETNPHYTYSVGDAAMAYDEGKVPEFTRQFLHLQPDTIIIFDRVTAGDPDYEKRWLLHTVEQPKVTGDTAVVTHLKGRLFSTTLLPADARVEVVGGPGREFWSDGQNFPIMNKRKECEPGAWRIEVYPGAPRKTDLFCHVLYLSDSAREAAPPVQLTDGKQVRLSFADAGKDYTVSLTKDGLVGGHVRITEGAKVLIDQDLTRTIQPQRFEPAAMWSEGTANPAVLPEGDNGIAAKYPGDKGIENDPAVIFAEGFEAAQIPTVGSGKMGGFYDLRGYPDQMNITGNEAAVGEHCLELVHPKGIVSPQWLHRNFPGQDTIYVRFYRKYAQNWVWPPTGAHDTLLFAGRYSSPAATDLTLYLDIPQGPTKWIDKANRDMSRQPVLTLKSSYQGPGLDFGHGKPIISHVGWDNYYGLPYNIDDAVYMEGGRWYCFEYMAKMNSVSDKGKADGEIRLWIDGKLTTEMTGLILRNDSHMDIKWDHWMLGPRYGIESTGSPKTQDSWIDAIVVAKEYIGPSKPPKSKTAKIAVIQASGMRRQDPFMAGYDPAKVRPQMMAHFNKLLGLIEQAGRQGADLVCGPEDMQHIGAYGLHVDVKGPETDEILFTSLAVPVPGPLTNKIAQIARRYQMYIIAPLYERDGEKVFNTAVIFDRQGNIIGKHRKTALPIMETWLVCPGDQYNVYKTDFANVAIATCWELFFPEISSIYALKGADIIFNPTMARENKSGQSLSTGHRYITRATDNSVYIAPVILGTDGNGIIDFNGKVIAEAVGKADTVIMTEIDFNKERTQKSTWWTTINGTDNQKAIRFLSRRPETYKLLTEPNPPVLERYKAVQLTTGDRKKQLKAVKAVNYGPKRDTR